MNRTMRLTVVALWASVAAAMATSAETVVQPPVVGQQLAVATSAPGVAAGAQTALRVPSRGDPPRCEPDVAARYREWHHGGLKLAPGCAAAPRG